MYYYRYKLAEPKLDRDGVRLHRLVTEDQAQLIHLSKNQIGIWKYDNVEDERVEYVMISHNTPLGKPEDYQILNPQVMGYCSLNKLKDWAAIETAILYTSPEWRGQGVAYKLYEWILHDGQIVICGEQHNPKSRALWLKLLQDQRYVVWACDMKNIDRQSDVWIDEDGEIICNLKLYVDIKMKKRKMKEDIRLIAINPRKIK